MSKLRFYDRLLNQEAAGLAGKEPGRLLLVTEDSIDINGVRASNGDFLLPATDDKAWIRLGEDQTLIIENFPFNHFPEKGERDNLMAIGKRLQDLEANKAAWQEWLTVTPIALNNTEKLQILPFERMLQKYLWHLQRICEQP